MPALSDVIAALDTLWPRERAEGWDAVGTVCGEPQARVGRVLFAVDPVHEIAEEAVTLGADLLVTHHPLYLRPTSTVAADTFKGRVVHTLIRHGIALHVAHTNADRSDPGVSDALAAALGARVLRPLVPDPGDPAGGSAWAACAHSTTRSRSPNSPAAPPSRCPRPPRAYGRQVTPISRCARSRCAAAPATGSSRRCVPPASTPT